MWQYWFHFLSSSNLPIISSTLTIRIMTLLPLNYSSDLLSWGSPVIYFSFLYLSCWAGLIAWDGNYTAIQTSNLWSPHILWLFLWYSLFMFSSFSCSPRWVFWTLTLYSFSYSLWIFCVMAVIMWGNGL